MQHFYIKNIMSLKVNITGLNHNLNQHHPKVLTFLCQEGKIKIKMDCLKSWNIELLFLTDKSCCETYFCLVKKHFIIVLF